MVEVQGTPTSMMTHPQEFDTRNARSSAIVSLDLAKTAEISSRFSSNEFLQDSASIEDLDDTINSTTSTLQSRIIRPTITDNATTVSSSGSETVTPMERNNSIMSNLRSTILPHDYMSSGNYNSYLCDISPERHTVDIINGDYNTSTIALTADDPNELTAALLQSHDYTLISASSSVHELSSMQYFGVDNSTGEKVILKVSPAFDDTVLLAATINEWFILSQLNPQEISHSMFDRDISMADRDRFAAQLLTPKTLPGGIEGVLYPIRTIPITVALYQGKPQRRFALVFEDRDFIKVKDYYAKQVSSETGSFKDKGSTVESNSTYDSLLNRATSHTSGSFTNSEDVYEHKKKRTKSSRQVVEILTDMIKVVKILSKIHQYGLVHNNITSSSILKSSSNPDDLVLSSWRNSFFLQPEDATNLDTRNHLHLLPETLPYMSPEAIGSENRGADFRSDFYSVGVVLYELLVGHVPFKNEFPLKIIRMHVFHRPVAPKIIASHYITTDLSNLIMKLMEKDPWKRYTDATHLVNDLVELKNHYVEKLKNNDPEVKFNVLKYTKDTQIAEKTNPRIIFPQKAFGRTDEHNTLSNIYQNQDHNIKFIMIAGERGIGKSTMLRDLSDLPLSKQNFFFYLNFERLSTGGIYSAYLLGIRECVKQIISAGSLFIDKWKSIIMSNISMDISLVRGLIPELAEILGEYSESNSSFMVETENFTAEGFRTTESIGDKTFNMEIKLRHLIKSFYYLLSLYGLTIFCDNVEYCTKGEWQLLSEITHRVGNGGSKQNPSITIFFACNSEAESFKSWKQKLKEEAAKLNAKFADIRLHGIGEQSFKSLWKNSTLSERNSFMYERRKHAPMGPLIDQDEEMDPGMNLASEELLQATNGNVLTLKFLVGYLIFKGEVTYVANNRNGFNGQWSISADAVPEQLSLKDSINNFKDVALNQKCLQILSYASLTGGKSFSLWDISMMSKTPIVEASKCLNYCSRLGFIVPETGSYKLPFEKLYSNELPFPVDEKHLNNLAKHATYSFAHDFVKEIFFEELVASGDLESFHKTVALEYYALYHEIPDISMKNFVSMANHFLESAEIASEDEIDLYFDVFIKAGKLTLSVFNFQQSLRYFFQAQKLIESVDSTRNLQCVNTVSQLLFYMESFQECLDFIDSAYDKYSFQEKVLLLIKVRCLINLGRNAEAVEIVLVAAEDYGIETGSTKSQYLEIQERYSKKIPTSISEIRNMSKMEKTEDLSLISLFELISEIVIPCYLIQENEVKNMLLVQAIHLTSLYGLSGYCAIPMIDYANVLAKQGSRAKFLTAIEYVKLALGLVDRDNAVSFTYVQFVYEVYASSFAAYIEPLGDVLKYHEIVTVSSKAYSRFHSSTRDFIFGLTRMHLLYLTGHTYENIYTEACAVDIQNTIEGQGLQKMGLRLLHGDLTLTQFESLYSDNIQTSAYKFGYNFFRVWYLNCQRRYDELIRLVQEDNYDDMLPNTLLHIEYYFAIAVALSSGVKVETKVRAHWTQKIFNFFDLWNSVNPGSFAAKFVLIQILLKRNTNSSSLEILDLFEESIDLSRAHGNWYEVGWANILCADWLSKINKNNKRIANFVKEGLILFRSLDAALICQTIENDYRDVLEDFNWAGIDAIKERSTSMATSLSNSHIPSTRKLRSMVTEASALNAKRGNMLQVNLDDLADERRNSSPEEYDQPIDLNMAVKACLDISDTLAAESAVSRLLRSAIAFSSVDYGVVVMRGNEEPYIATIGSLKKIYQLENEPLSSRTDICPFSLILHVLQTGLIVDREKDALLFEQRFSNDDYYAASSSYAALCLPLKSDRGVYGVLYLERQFRNVVRLQTDQPFFDDKKRDLINLLCCQATVALTKMELYSQMENAKWIAEDATAEKASFLANMSHEIRTPFNSLLSCSIFLLDTKLSRTQREYVETIKSSAMVTLNIIDGILAFSKIEHGSFTLDNEPFSIVESIEDAIQLVGEQAAINDLELVFFNRVPFITHIFGDETRFRQIIINLVGNAVKFTTIGHIIVELDAKEITDNRFEICIAVEDTGIGIPEGSINKVFGAFSQVDSSARRIHGGSGLGLALSKKLVELMGGSLTFDSIEGQGSTFYFNFNAGVELETEPPFIFESSMTNMTPENRQTLIIDEHNLTRKSLEEILLWYDLGVTIVDRVAEANFKQELLAVFVHYEQAIDFVKVKDLLNPKTKIIIVSQFGKPLPIEIDDSDIYHILLAPLQRAKVIGLLKSLYHDRKEIELTLPPVAVLSNQYPLNILLAEDNLINYKVALQHLKKLGYAADHAKDGVEVIDKCLSLLDQSKKYDVILMDIQMPRKDGITATKELRELFISEGRTDFLPEIVALTANVAGEDRQRSLKCGMVDFVSKPIIPENLRKVLQNIGERKSALTEVL